MVEEEAVQENFRRQPMLRLLGARLHLVRPGVAEIVIPYDERFTQQRGFVHAGVVTTIGDTAGGYAGHSLMPDGSDVLATEFKFNFVRPARGPWLLARAEVAKAGRTLTVTEIKVYQGEEEALAGRWTRTDASPPQEGAELVALAVQTLICVPGGRGLGT